MGHMDSELVDARLQGDSLALLDYDLIFLSIKRNHLAMVPFRDAMNRI